MKMVKNLTVSNIKNYEGFERREDLDFTDDGNRFRGFSYKNYETEKKLMKHAKTKQMKEAYERYLKSNESELWQVYGTCSTAKQQAMEYCKALMYKHNGRRGRIIGHSCHKFSYGFIGEMADEKTGEVKEAFVFITADNDRYIYMDELEA